MSEWLEHIEERGTAGVKQPLIAQSVIVILSFAKGTAPKLRTPATTAILTL
jgi:hypothetical protein